MLSNELWRQSAAELARLIRSGLVSSREVLESCLTRLEHVNPRLNAIVLTLAETAREEANAADAAVRAGLPLGPLHGVPVATKVNTDHRGCPTDNAVVSLKNLVATQDSPLVANLRKAGAIFIGRTNAPAFSMRWFTDSELHGRAFNPWNALYTPGGSSGGAGAAVAAGICPIAQGNDIAGSIRYPSYCCGVFGLKPTYGRVPAFNFTARPFSTISAQILSVQGPLARHVSDLRLGFTAMTGATPFDPRCVDVVASAAPVRPLRVALAPKPGAHAVHPAIEAAVRQVGSRLQAAGYVVEEVELPNFDEAARLWPAIAMPDVIATLEKDIASSTDQNIKRAVGFWRECWPHRDPAACLTALGERLRLQRAWRIFMERYPVVVTPISLRPSFEWDEDLRDAATTGRIIEAQAPLLALSVLGFPAIAAPTGLHDGRPVGVQVIAAPYAEDLCFEIAEVIEAHAPVPIPPL